jgi:3'-phosphoadenosine 5'-phosphosulfate sulfotransferase (PAPS reductase)/FAD synthetase
MVTGNPMLDLCSWKGRFPSRRAQFCTQHLKREPLERYQNSIYENNEVTIWTGVRRNESPARANIKEHEQIAEGFYFHRPLADLTTEDVFAGLDYYGIERNPLYELGFTRVGCMPCVNANKGEVKLMAKIFPEVIERIRRWEYLVGLSAKRGLSSFFHARSKGLNFRDGYLEGNIDSTVLWAQTTRGGKQFSLPEMSETCILAEGMCE